MAEPEITLREQGALGRITLNRPKAINSLTLDMVRDMHAALRAWRADDRIRAVLIDGAGERGLCAGGDVRSLHDAVKAGDEAAAETFWAEEYQLNAALGAYPKPVIGLMDGICMGGGVGVSAHGSHRVVTERSKVGMPEVGIGFVPDVGGTFLLARAPGELGTHLALTGAPVTGADAVLCGLADQHVPSASLPELIDALGSEQLATDGVDAVLAKFAEPVPDAPLAVQRGWIDAAYAAADVPGILQRLRDRPEPEAQAAADTIAQKSPTSLKVALRAVRTAPDTLPAALQQEYRVATACVRIGDFVEGVRATLVDKDHAPRWDPATLDEVDEQRVEQFFRPLLGEPDITG
ncbi:enoyl-CoA hydratase/isomerase family protein [Saccharopolyspora sp. HNM0983]|uniref:3-hydroxyisobutyryl-CoA hydrolase n=1 Tax=Saccharopolyspora montiporae TaxID=2781240 RepID=A0A929FZN7_9PSEU|nr:enoyl-CoA hydratase/isomerase family protein [Saccharopolyspora sp. HNM0983]MBE9374544.1 enoyl-CoA hydratase/isomerase family protein [Saccharopolyspora sp. HNM0983]